jgi:hypothetical protein
MVIFEFIFLTMQNIEKKVISVVLSRWLPFAFQYTAANKILIPKTAGHVNNDFQYMQTPLA